MPVPYLVYRVQGEGRKKIMSTYSAAEALAIMVEHDDAEVVAAKGPIDMHELRHLADIERKM